MTDSLTGGLRLGPQDRLTIRWGGAEWSAMYSLLDEHGKVVQAAHKVGIPGETSEEVCRNAIAIAQLSQET